MVIQNKQKIIIKSDNNALDFVTLFGTWLHVVARAHELDMIKFVVKAGLDININAGIPNAAPIVYVAGAGELSIVEYLLDKGTFLDVSGANKNPLFLTV